MGKTASILEERGGDFLEDSARSGLRVGSRGDGPANHQIVSPSTNSFRWSRNPGLIVLFAFAWTARTFPSLWPDAGNANQKLFPAGPANGAHLVRRHYNTIEAWLTGELGQFHGSTRRRS